MRGFFRDLILTVTGGIFGAALMLVLTKMVEPAVADNGIVTARAVNLVDETGKLRSQMAITKDGGPGVWLMDRQGVARVNLEVYPDDTGFIVLNDAKSLAVQILRSFGPQESPLHIFKAQGRDALIMGLNPAADRTPFSFFYDEKSTRKFQFGKYSGP
jgi:hypothetical protein